MTTQQELAERLADYQKYRHMSDGPLMVPPADELIDEVITALRAPPNIGDAPRKSVDTSADTFRLVDGFVRHGSSRRTASLCEQWAFAEIERLRKSPAKDEVPAVGKWPSEEKIIRALVIVAVRDGMSPPLGWTDDEVITLATQSDWRLATIQARAVLALPGQAGEAKNSENIEYHRWPRKGDRMRFLGKNGYEHERKAAMKLFVVGHEYEVIDCYVEDWHHTVSFVGKPGRHNGVMFELPSGSGSEGER